MNNTYSMNPMFTKIKIEKLEAYIEYLKEQIKTLELKNGNLLKKNDKLQTRINKAIDILSNGSKYIKICTDYDINQMQLAIKSLEGYEVEDENR